MGLYVGFYLNILSKINVLGDQPALLFILSHILLWVEVEELHLKTLCLFEMRRKTHLIQVQSYDLLEHLVYVRRIQVIRPGLFNSFEY